MRTSKEKISLFILFQCYAEGRQPRNKDILQLKKGRPHLRTKVTSITIYLPADNIRRAFNKITHSSWLTKTWLNNTVWSTWSMFRQTVRTNIDVEDDFYILLFIYTHIFRIFGKQYVYIYILTSVVYHKQYGCKQGRIEDFKLGGGAHLKKIAPSGGRRENFWGISCEKSRFYAKKYFFFQF